MKAKAIVFNCSYNGLSIIQELSKEGIECIAMDCFRGIGTYSRYAQSVVKCADPKYKEAEFIEQLYELCRQEEVKPVLFPTNDEWAMAISKHKNRLDEVAHVCSGDSSCVDIILNKDRFYEIGSVNNFMTPKTWSRENLRDISEHEFPIVAKAKFKSVPDGESEVLNKELEKNRLIILNNQEELESYFLKNDHILPYMVFQEYVRGNSGQMFTVGIYADEESSIKALFTGRKVRGYPAEYGDNIVGESCTVPDKLIENVKKIISYLNYSGIAEFEYKKDEETGEFKLIEINPRSWSWIGITPHCGINIPLIAYLDLTGINKEIRQLNQNEEKVRYVKVFQDFVNCIFRYKKTYPAWAMSYKEWRMESKSAKNIYAELHRRDYMVTFISFFYLLAKIVKQRSF